ncbi:MAG: hypothetical protein ACFE96_04750, partial [Candidatus Hermodarchaeota archaeon]
MQIKKKILNEICHFSSLTLEQLRDHCKLDTSNRHDLIRNCLSTQSAKDAFNLIVKGLEECKELVKRRDELSEQGYKEMINIFENTDESIKKQTNHGISYSIEASLPKEGNKLRPFEQQLATYRK